MTDTLANGGAPASPAPAPQAAGAIAPPSAPVIPGSKAWAEMPAEARHAQLRGPENPGARGYSPAVEQREAAAARAAGDQPAPSPTADPQQPAATGEKVKIGKYEISEAELGTMMQRQAVEDRSEGRRLSHSGCL